MRKQVQIVTAYDEECRIPHDLGSDIAAVFLYGRMNDEQDWEPVWADLCFNEEAITVFFANLRRQHQLRVVAIG